MAQRSKQTQVRTIQAEARRYANAMLERMVSLGLGDIQESTGKPAPFSTQFEAQKYVLERGLGKIPDRVVMDVDVNVAQMSQQQLREIVSGKYIEGECNRLDSGNSESEQE